MKLFLSSMAISAEQLPEFLRLASKSNPADIHLALIENAADGEAGDKTWVLENRKALRAHGFRVELIDLNDKALAAKLANCDVIWLGGGNIFYLRRLLKETQADQLITNLVKAGKVYGGGSAGAIVAGPTLQHFETADVVEESSSVVTAGLHLTDTVVVPHYDNPQFADHMRLIATKLEAEGYAVARLTDAQALVVNDTQEKII